MNADQWRAVAEEFEAKWQFPHCVGAIDGKHVKIQPPPGSGSYYLNYKGCHSIVLMAVANANYEFIYIDVGANGRVSDGGVWGNCTLSKCLDEENNAGLPPPAMLKKSAEFLRYVFVADDAFPLKTNLMKPFPFRNQTDEQRIYSYRLSRVIRIIENSFGIMGSRFRVLSTTIALTPEKVEKIVLACAVLHNVLRKCALEEYNQPGTMDEENEETGVLHRGTWRKDGTMLPLQTTETRNPSIEAKNIRNKFCHYFNNEGQVPWQMRMAGIE